MYLLRFTTILAMITAVSVLSAQSPGEPLTPLFSLYSNEREDNFSTTDRRWQAPRIGEMINGYRYTAVEGRIFTEPRPGTVPLVHWYSEQRGDNLVTTDPRFRTSPPDPSYRLVGTAGHIFSPDAPQPPRTIPLYAAWSGSRADNLVTTDPSWRGTRYGEVLGRPDYIFVSVAGYVYPPELSGFIDLHAHPMSHLGFGRKLIHGAPDVGSILPARSRDCAPNVRAASIEEALGTDNTTHGGHGAFDNSCGDHIRKIVIRELQTQRHAYVTPDWAGGIDHKHNPPAADFLHWPKWNDITHQKMWIDWIRRAHWGGLRVMVALAVHNQTLAASVMGPGDFPGDDKASADLQIDETRAMIARHNDFMEVALTAADVRRIVQAGKLAVVLGMEIDGIGNFNSLATPSQAVVKAEILRLHAKGVRYMFPIHLLDNKFGGTAVYEGMFDLSNFRETTAFWTLECSRPEDNISWRYDRAGFDFFVGLLKAVKLGIDPLRKPPTPPSCPPGTGHVNSRGLTALGQFAIREMMKLGMLIDIDHMSQKSVEGSLNIAHSVPGAYPVNSGHNGFRGGPGNENSRTAAQIQRIKDSGGVFGVGTTDATIDTFVQSYLAVAARMGRGIGIGSDMNGMEKGPRPGPVRYDANFPKLVTRSKTWEFAIDGGAHYGMLGDFVRGVKDHPSGASVYQSLMLSAEHFAQMWEKCELQKSKF